MFEINIQEIDKQNENTTLKKTINLDQDLDCFISLSCKDKVLADNIFNHTIESIIDKISKEDSYNDFGIALESINGYIKNWRSDNTEETNVRIDMIISILNENDFMFSNIGKTGVYLVNTNDEVIELTEKGENKKEFLFISNGALTNGDIVISSTINLLKYLTKSDLVDGVLASDDLNIFGKNITNILSDEILSKNAIISSMRYENEYYEEVDRFAGIKNVLLSIADLPTSKRITSTFLRIKDTINTQSSMVRNGTLLGIILLGMLGLYSVVSGVVGEVSHSEVTQEAGVLKTEVEDLIASASQNISNPQTFQENIQKAEEKLTSLEEKKKFQSEVDTLTDRINLLKKQFNKIEIFEPGEDAKVFVKDFSDAIQIVQYNKKNYVITQKSVVGPIIEGKEPKVYTFDELQKNESFMRADFINSNLFLVTNTSKVVRFASNGRFSFVNVNEQEKWEDIKDLGTYGTNLYTLGKDNQIYKHIALSNNFGAKNGYLKPGDREKIGNILGISIDGGFYIVKDNLKMFKFFSSPYRLEELEIYNTPKNFTYNGGKFLIKSRINLNYVYILMNDTIWVFKTNSRSYTGTTQLTYLGQIEGGKHKIQDFYVDTDTSLLVLDKTGVYKLNFEISDKKLLLK